VIRRLHQQRIQAEVDLVGGLTRGAQQRADILRRLAQAKDLVVVRRSPIMKFL
jgi:hypothetical protein